MAYVIVTADFPNVTAEQREKIYDCLKRKKWKKVTDAFRDISTVWYGYFSSGTEKSNIEAAINNFTECSKVYCKVKLVIHWGPNEPTFHNSK